MDKIFEVELYGSDLYLILEREDDEVTEGFSRLFDTIADAERYEEELVEVLEGKSKEEIIEIVSSIEGFYAGQF